MPAQRVACSFTGNPNACKTSSSSRCVPGCSAPSNAPIAYAKNESFRSAVRRGSFWRKPPAAVLRGFAKSCFPSAARAALSAAKALLRKYTSPRTSIVAGNGPRSVRGMSRIVLTLLVTSSPTVPSPRVPAERSAPPS